MDSKGTSTQKLAMAGVLTAAAVVGSLISIPIAGSKCAPVQHMVNVFAAVLLGPWWGFRHRFLCQPDPQCSGDWQFSRFSGKYDRCTLLWSYVSFHRQTFSYLRC